jgi:cytochrome c-type biogenesis protein CcmE
MTKQKSNPIVKFVIAGAIVVGTVAWLSISAAGNAKSYYVTIGELQSMGNKAYKENLRVAGNVQPGSITRFGPNANFVLVEKDKMLRVKYEGAEPPPDEFKDDAQHVPRNAAAGQVRQQICSCQGRRSAYRKCGGAGSEVVAEDDATPYLLSAFR